MLWHHFPRVIQVTTPHPGYPSECFCFVIPLVNETFKFDLRIFELRSLTIVKIYTCVSSDKHFVYVLIEVSLVPTLLFQPVGFLPSVHEGDRWHKGSWRYWTFGRPDLVNFNVSSPWTGDSIKSREGWGLTRQRGRPLFHLLYTQGCSILSFSLLGSTTLILTSVPLF